MIKQLTKVTILPLLIGMLFADDWAIESVYLDLGLGQGFSRRHARHASKGQSHCKRGHFCAY